MDGSVNPSEVATLSLLGGGGGYGYGNRHGQFADDSSNAVRINAGHRASVQSHDALSQQISDNADRNRDIASLQNTNAQNIANRDFNTQVAFGLSNQIDHNAEVSARGFNAVSREIAETAREAAKCCCEAKLLAVQNQAKTDAAMATILANQSADTRVADAVANANQNAKLDLILLKS